MSGGRHVAVPDRALPGAWHVLLFRLAVVAAIVLGTTAFVALDTTVTLRVDGQQREVHGYVDTVADLLDREGIGYDLDHDMVLPAPGSAVSDGDTVQVRHSRPLLLTIDGDTRRVWTTGRTVSEALTLLGVRSEGAWVSASRSRRIGKGGLVVNVRIPRHVTFLADGRRHEVTTTAPTVRSAMTEAGVAIRVQDRVSADLSLRPYDEQVVGLTRVDGRRAVQERPVAFDTERRKSDELYEGTVVVQTEGKVGVARRTFRETYLDGELDSRQLVRTRVTDPPVDRVLLVGTAKRPDNTPVADGLNWAALAQCESGGDPTAYNPAGPYYGLYQFMAATWAGVGGVGLPSEASASEQTYRAQILYNRSGAGQWPVCGSNLFR